MSSIVIIGGGAAGIAAAQGALNAGANLVSIIERSDKLGGILHQCIHDGFGLSKYKKSMTGPEYAAAEIGQIQHNERVQIKTNASVTKLECDKAGMYKVLVQSRAGMECMEGNSVVFATGCRERTRGMLMIPGDRPTGVYTAGLAQNLVNIHNIMPGKRVVILGSGDIGLIMARRFHLEGADVVAVLEVMKDSGGLSRNIRQCLQDFDIPIYTGCTVSRIIGKNRVEAVEVCDVNDDFSFKTGTKRTIACDTLILSVGLIPENEVLIQAGVDIDDKSGKIWTDQFLQTSMNGVFAAGNSRCVHDLVDRVSAEGYIAGQNAAAYAEGGVLKEAVDIININAAKGIPDKEDIFCVLCPNGCEIKAETDPDGSMRVTGNKCPKGLQFAGQELRAAERIVTTTIKCNDGRLIPIRSLTPVPLNSMKEYIRECRNIILDLDHISNGARVKVNQFPDAVICCE